MMLPVPMQPKLRQERQEHCAEPKVTANGNSVPGRCNCICGFHLKTRKYAICRSVTRYESDWDFRLHFLGEMNLYGLYGVSIKVLRHSIRRKMSLEIESSGQPLDHLLLHVPRLRAQFFLKVPVCPQTQRHRIPNSESFQSTFQVVLSPRSREELWTPPLYSPIRM